MKAFPQNEATMHIDLPLETQQGMDLRDYFAAKAMPIALQLFVDSHGEELPYIDDETGEPMDYEVEGSRGIWYPHSKTFAIACYSIADNMMKVREK